MASSQQRAAERFNIRFVRPRCNDVRATEPPGTKTWPAEGGGLQSGLHLLGEIIETQAHVDHARSQPTARVAGRTSSRCSRYPVQLAQRQYQGTFVRWRTHFPTMSKRMKAMLLSQEAALCDCDTQVQVAGNGRLTTGCVGLAGRRGRTPEAAHCQAVPYAVRSRV